MIKINKRNTLQFVMALEDLFLTKTSKGTYRLTFLFGKPYKSKAVHNPNITTISH
jgi:hypothetical protein